MIDRRANAVRAAVADSAIRRAVDMLLDYDDDGYRHDHQAA